MRAKLSLFTFFIFRRFFRTRRFVTVLYHFSRVRFFNDFLRRFAYSTSAFFWLFTYRVFRSEINDGRPSFQLGMNAIFHLSFKVYVSRINRFPSLFSLLQYSSINFIMNGLFFASSINLIGNFLRAIHGAINVRSNFTISIANNASCHLNWKTIKARGTLFIDIRGNGR